MLTENDYAVSSQSGNFTWLNEAHSSPVCAIRAHTCAPAASPSATSQAISPNQLSKGYMCSTACVRCSGVHALAAPFGGTHGMNHVMLQGHCNGLYLKPRWEKSRDTLEESFPPFVSAEHSSLENHYLNTTFGTVTFCKMKWKQSIKSEASAISHEGM